LQRRAGQLRDHGRGPDDTGNRLRRAGGLGSIFTDRRRTQSTTDLAAIVAASNLSNATNAATATVTKNNYPASDLVSVVLGTYTANAAISPQARFVTPAVGTPNAARVTMKTQTPLYFAHYLTGANQYNITTTATAATTQMAAFAIGSRLLSLKRPAQRRTRQPAGNDAVALCHGL
jgi:uncharacterized membrane protein